MPAKCSQLTALGDPLYSAGVCRRMELEGMSLDPESQRLIDLMAAANRPAWNTLSPAAARDLYLSLRPAAQGPRPADVTIVDRIIPGPAGQLPVRLYRPTSVAADANLPGLVYAHGGR